MQYKNIQGVPYWVDSANKAYIFEKKDEKPQAPIQIGTYDPKTETITLRENWKEVYAQTLQNYRESQASRPRKVGDK